jgi:N-acetylglucosamine-6-phosphate deacetylase
MQNSLKIKNGKIITPYRIIENKCIIIKNGVIVSLCDEPCPESGLPVIDAGGLFVSPGFIDVHLHGGGGYDFMDGSEEAIVEPARTHARFGTTSLTPTTVAGDFDKTKRFIDCYKGVAGNSSYKGAALIGIHIEGPYFSAAQRGAQDIRYIRNPDRREYEAIAGLSENIVRWDAAPELPGCLEFGDFLRSKGIVASVAHSDATYDEALEAGEHGFSHITHLYSGTSTVSRRGAFRIAGINEYAFLHDEVTVEIIADGCHLPPSLLKLIYKIKGPSRILLITDAMRAAGTDLRVCRIGDAENGMEVIIEDGVAKLPDRTSFAGSVATMNRLVRNMVRLAGVSIENAVQMATCNPAKLIGIDKKKGIIAPGFDADIIIFDDNIDISATIVKGVLVYGRAGLTLG